MKKVICLYRVSTIGQVDHDDIPMQRLACREYAKTHPDWEIINEISEKGMEKNNKKANEVQVDEILSWASRFDDASYEAKHLVIAQLVDRIEIRKNDGYDITIHWRMTAEQFLGRKKEESA